MGERAPELSFDPLLLTSKDVLMSITAKINGIEQPTIIDTGSFVNIISLKLAREIGLNIDHSKKRPLRIVDGKTIWTEGEVQITIALNEEEMKVAAAVIKDFPFGLLCGLKWLRENKVILNCEP